METDLLALNVHLLEAVPLRYGCVMTTPGQKKLAELRTPAGHSLSAPITQELPIVAER